ncbi:MAG: hypothetical protein JO063_07730 [Pseudonocardiales bacterium]|nr:hypothetical protein [Pseudonocardiales bacterium]MBV9030993.1 hypothetical protein [Pseudonocardiales bacterium]MBW0009991.1 hypothetical protein [Pseudonocardiales bacterium]
MDRRVRRAVLDRLAAVEEIVARASATLSAPLARRHIQTIAGGWRELLVQHQPDATGRCPVCSGWLRHRRWPCEMWVTAHRHLIGDSTGSVERSARNSNPFCRPRRVVVVPRQPDAPAAEQAGASKASPRREAGKASIHRA